MILVDLVTVLFQRQRLSLLLLILRQELQKRKPRNQLLQFRGMQFQEQQNMMFIIVPVHIQAAQFI